MPCECGECTCCVDASGSLVPSGSGAVDDCFTLQPQVGLCDAGGPNVLNLLVDQVSCGGSGLGICLDAANSNVTVTDNGCDFALNYDDCLPRCACANVEQNFGSAIGNAGVSTGNLLYDQTASVTNSSDCDMLVLEIFTPKCLEVETNAGDASVGLQVEFNILKGVNGGALQPGGCTATFFHNVAYPVLGNRFSFPVVGAPQQQCNVLPAGGTLDVRYQIVADVTSLNNQWSVRGGGEITLFGTTCG